MVGIVFLNSFHWYHKHGSRMYITHIKHRYRTPYVVERIQGGNTFVFRKIMQRGVCTCLSEYVDCMFIYSQIEDEEALLAVAAWPMLVELIIHSNPLTTENSGDPPLLQRFLGDRLGIRIKRYQTCYKKNTVKMVKLR